MAHLIVRALMFVAFLGGCTCPLAELFNMSNTGATFSSIDTSQFDAMMMTPTPTPAAIPTVAPVTDDQAGVEDAIREAIEENVRATNEEDIDLYMSRIHPDSPVYPTTEALVTTVFNTYDLDTEVELGDITISLDGQEARIEFVLTTRKLSGPTFQDNEVTGIFILRQDDGVWKVYNQEITNVRAI